MTNADPIKTALSLAATQLKTQGIEAETAKLEAQLLLQHALNVNRAWLIAHENDALQANIHEVYRTMLERRLNGEPIAYILGYREFYGLNLKVSADTLIPRADTETLVEAALAKIGLLLTPSPQPSPSGGEGAKNANSSSTSPNAADVADSSPSPQRGRGVGERGHDNINILDLGTGTGAIALAIAKHRPQANVTALDASQASLNIAVENAENLNIHNVKFILSDWFSALSDEKFDVIVSNPPYIEAADTHLKQGDLRFEPLAALASGADGLDAIRTIITQAPQHLNPHGWLMLEHGYNQATSVAALLKQASFSEISHVQDLAGINRVTIGKFSR
jgi:release factor glutamine methyltransferase